MLTATSQDSISIWMGQVTRGEEPPIRKLLERFLPRLVALAAARLRNHPRLLSYAEDIALSVFHSLCRGAERGRFRDLSNRKAIWQLLAVMTIRKTIDLLRQTRCEASTEPTDYQTIAARQPDPAELADLAERRDELLHRLEHPELRLIAQWKCAGFSNDEIATKLGCNVRTVERRLQKIREKWAPREQKRQAGIPA